MFQFKCFNISSIDGIRELFFACKKKYVIFIWIRIFEGEKGRQIYCLAGKICSPKDPFFGDSSLSAKKERRKTV